MVEEVCGQMLSIVANEDGSLSLNQKVLSNIHCMQHDDDDAFWESEKKWSGTWENTTIIRRQLKLAQIIYFAYALCDAIASSYSKLSHHIIKLIRNRCNRGEKEGERDKVDSCNDDDEHRMTYEVEMYLRRLYLSFKAQSFVDEEGETDDHYVGSRQQCLYSCVCFVVLFFDLYDNFDAIGMKNVAWLTCTVLNRGCGDLLESSGLSENEKRVLSSLGGGGKKLICQCVFDLVNTKNPSGGLIGPGNCMWFHRLILRLSGRVGAWYKKLIKNNEAIHDAFGFLVSQLDVGPGYMYGIYGDLINVGISDGGNGVSWWSHQCFMGQLSGLLTLGRLMSNKSRQTDSFLTFDRHNRVEEETNRYYLLLESTDDDGRTLMSWRRRRRGGAMRV